MPDIPDLKKLVQDKDAATAVWVAKLIVTLVVDIIKVYFSGGAAVGGLISDLVGAATTGGPDFTVQDKINELIDAVNRLKQEFVEAYILLRIEAIDDQMAPSITAWKLLLADPRPKLNADGTVDLAYAENQLFACDTTLQSLGPELSDEPSQNEHWLGDYQLMQDVFYSRMPWFGVGSGEYDEDSLHEIDPPVTAGFHFMAPTELEAGSAEGWLVPEPEPANPPFVFNHIYILPSFLQAISIYLSVGGVLLPGFPQTRADLIRSYAQFLGKVHEKIASDGLIMLSPPSPAEIYSVYNVGYQRTDLGVVGVDKDGFLAGGEWRDYSRFQPFGAVDLYSGTEAILPYPRIRYSPTDFVLVSASKIDTTRTLPWETLQTLSTGWLRLFYGKYRLRSLACAKVLYKRLALDQVRLAVNGLCTLVGDPAMLGGPSFGDWSVREAFAAVNDPTLPLSARALITFVRSAAPADTELTGGLRALFMGDVATRLAAQ